MEASTSQTSSSHLQWTGRSSSGRQGGQHSLISTQFPNSNTYIGIIVGLDNDVMDDQGEERIVLLWSKWGLCHGRRLVSGNPLCLSGNSTCWCFLSFISLPFFTSSDQLTQVFNWCFLSFISLPFLHQFWPVLTHTGTHGLICKRGSRRLCSVVGSEHKHWGACCYLQAGQSELPK